MPPEFRVRRIGAGFLRVVGGSAAGQLIALVTLPLLTRVLAPEDFGYISRGLALAMVLSIAMTLRLEIAMFSTKQKNRQYAIGVSGLAMAVAAFALVSILIAVMPFAWLTWIGEFQLIDLFAILLVGLSLAGFNTFSNLAAADGRYAVLARSRPIKQVTEIAVLAALAMANAPGWLLLFSTVIGCALASYSLANIAALTGAAMRLRAGPLGWALVRRYRAFIAYDLPASLLVHIRLALPLVFLGQRFDLATVGLFAVAQRLLDAPAALAASSVGMVYRAELSRYPSPRRLFLYVTVGLLAVAVAMVGGVVVIPEGLFVQILGGEWAQIKFLMGALAAYAIARIVALPIGFTYYVTENVRLNLVLQLGGLVVVVLAFVLAPPGTGLIDVVSIYALSQAVFYAAYVAIAYALVSRMPKSIIGLQNITGVSVGKPMSPGSEA